MIKTQHKVVDKTLSQYTLFLPLIMLRSFFIVISLACNLFIRKCIVPFVPFWQVKRYIESVVNLMSMRTILIMLGFIKFECDSFRFFTREPSKLTLKSGFIAVGSHKSIIDYMYYSYLLNPVFVRIIVYKKQETEDIYYAPLSFMQGLRCAIHYRGFDPIIVHNQKQFRHVKYRKMAMKTLISQCFEETNGPVFILLPGIMPNEHVSLNRGVSQDIYKNEVQFQRSLVGFCVKLDERVGLQQQTYRNQLFLLLDLLSSFRINTITIHALQFRKFKKRYDKKTYSSFIDKYYIEHDFIHRDIDYQQYITEMDQIDQKSKKIRAQ